MSEESSFMIFLKLKKNNFSSCQSLFVYIFIFTRQTITFLSDSCTIVGRIKKAFTKQYNPVE
jgi:Mg2+ and Co2+ transporter CorA